MKKRLNLRNLQLYGRSDELSTLLDAYNRVAKNKNDYGCEIVMVHGDSGTGKSSLIRTFQRTIIEKEEICFFVSGKFDQQNTTEPYHALAAALNQLCGHIVASGNKDKTTNLFLDQVGSKGNVLLDVVPKLSELLADRDNEKVGPASSSTIRRNNRKDRDGKPESFKGTTSTALNQLKYVLRAFLRAVVSNHHPVVLYLDDLQWADATSLELLQSLMTDSESKRILFIGSYRDDNMDENQPLAVQLLDPIGKEKPTISIHVQNLTVDMVNELISHVTELDPDWTMPLTELVYRKTNGNAFFILQFLRMLEEEELLWFSLTSYTWMWDMDKIRAQTNSADNVVDLVANKIQRMPLKTRELLKFAACLWSTFDVPLLRQVWLRGCKEGQYFYANTDNRTTIVDWDDDLVSLLDKASQEGLLDKLANSRYKFAHDRIRQAAYSLAGTEEHDRLHYWIGGLLWELTTESGCEEWMYFAAADQMNRGVALITDDKERVDLARLNLLVGEKAIALSAFVPALSYLKSGVSLLPKGRLWQEHYELALKFHNAIVDMEYSVGNFEGVQDVANEISANAVSSKDKAECLYTLGLSLIAQSKPQQAVKLCHIVLASLGLPFPKRVTKAMVTLEYVRLRLLLRGRSNEDLLALPRMKDESTLIAAKFLDLAVNSALYLGMMRMVSLFAIRMMNLILRHGLCEEAPLAFVMWGEVLVEKGYFPKGYRFGKLALKLGDKLDSKMVKANVVMLAVNFLHHWKEPLQNSLDTLLDAHRTGMVSGDITWAFQCIVGYQLNYFYSGLPLIPGAEDLLAFSNQMREYNQETSRRTQAPVLQMMLNLMGRSNDIYRLTGEAMDQDEFENHETNPNRVGVQAIASCRMQLSYYFDNIDLAAELSKKLQSISKEAVFSVSFIACVRAMFFGLISVALARKEKKRKHAADALKIMNMMEEKWVKRGAVNCLHKFLLLKAEYATLKNPKSNKVREDFDAAISTARRVGFIQDEALANERAGVFFLEQGDEYWASSYLCRAIEVYSEWGAHAKVNWLEQRHSLILSKQVESHAMHVRGRRRFTDKTSKDHRSLNANQLFGDTIATSS